jgi:hypothetical protein
VLCERSIPFRLFYKLLKGTVRVDPLACPFGRLPGVFVVDIGGIKGPQRTDNGFDRMNEARLDLVEENAKVVQAGLNGKLVVAFTAIVRDKCLFAYFQESGDVMDLFIVYVDASFSITAFAAHLAFKGFHGTYK